MEREVIRLEQFRQLRKEIRGSANYLVVGIDVAKDKHDAYLGTPTGKSLYRRLIFENTMDGSVRTARRQESVRKHVALVVRELRLTIRVCNGRATGCIEPDARSSILKPRVHLIKNVLWQKMRVTINSDGHHLLCLKEERF